MQYDERVLQSFQKRASLVMMFFSMFSLALRFLPLLFFSFYWIVMGIAGLNDSC